MINFEQWELDDLQRGMKSMLEDHIALEDVIDEITGVNLDPGVFGEFLNRVVEVADRHRHRQAVREAKYAPNIS